MALLKKLIMAFLMSVAMLVAPSVMAAEDGPLQTLVDVIALNQETIDAMKSGADEAKVSALLKETKQASKSVVISGPADLRKQKGSGKIKKSRKAYRAGDVEKAIALAEEALDYYKEAKKIAF